MKKKKKNKQSQGALQIWLSPYCFRASAVQLYMVSTAATDDHYPHYIIRATCYCILKGLEKGRC